MPSLSARRAWIEIVMGDPIPALPQSLSARRAWIEIVMAAVFSLTTVLSLSARRAWIEINNSLTPARISSVALRKESVDRNTKWFCNALKHLWSLSARRAWIEMANALPITSPITKSLSARRAWIEITQCRL